MNSFFNNLSKYTGEAHGLLRIMTGLFFLQHGTQKILSFPVKFPFPLNAMSTTAGWLELVGGVLIILGLFTRPVAFILSGMCAVGYWYAHGGRGFYPITNGGELIALFCFVFLFLACAGSGKWGMDKN